MRVEDAGELLSQPGLFVAPASPCDTIWVHISVASTPAVLSALVLVMSLVLSLVRGCAAVRVTRRTCREVRSGDCREGARAGVP